MKLAKNTSKVNKTKKALKVYSAATAVMLTMAVCTIVASAAGGSEAAYQNTITFFVTWIRRIGMMVAFVGAIMFALAIKNNDAEQKQNGLITMVAGFVAAALCTAVNMFDLFA